MERGEGKEKRKGEGRELVESGRNGEIWAGS